MPQLRHDRRGAPAGVRGPCGRQTPPREEFGHGTVGTAEVDRLTLLCAGRSTSARSAGSFQGLALTLFLPQMRAGDADFSQFAPEP